MEKAESPCLTRIREADKKLLYSSHIQGNKASEKWPYDNSSQDYPAVFMRERITGSSTKT